METPSPISRPSLSLSIRGKNRIVPLFRGSGGKTKAEEKKKERKKIRENEAEEMRDREGLREAEKPREPWQPLLQLRPTLIAQHTDNIIVASAVRREEG